MTLSLLWITLGGALVYAAFKCRRFLPLLAARSEPGPNCTGSLLVLLTALIAHFLGGLHLPRIPIPGGKPSLPGGGGEPPTIPVPRTPTAPPTPELPPIEIPALPAAITYRQPVNVHADPYAIFA